jgi:enoyl-[acyl-carrier protein] reductase III
VDSSRKQFSGLWGIILGGSSGFGLAAVKKLALHGMNIALLYRETAHSEKKLKQALSEVAKFNEVNILPFNINALDAESRVSFVAQFKEVTGGNKKVRLLLHSIARGNLKPLVAQVANVGMLGHVSEALSIEDIQGTTYAMSASLLDWARMLLKESIFCDDARIVGLTSHGAHKYWDGYAAVSIAKASLESLATYMAVEFAKQGIKTNLIRAGITETPSLKRIAGAEKLIEMATAGNPMGRITKPEDVANVIYLLCTDEAFWINGSVIDVDGGEHCR